MFIMLKTGFVVSLCKSNFRIFTAGKSWRNKQNHTFFKLKGRSYLPYYLSDKGCVGTVVNRVCFSLNRGSLEITLTILFT